MSNLLNAGIVSIIMMCCVATTLAIGWVMNVYSFATSDFEAPYKSEIVRGVGIPFAPIGGVLGYLDIGDENVKEPAED